MKQNVNKILLKEAIIMRTKRNWLIIVIAVVMAGSLSGCMEKGQTIQPFNGVPSYMTTKDAKYFIENNYLSTYVSNASGIVDLYSFGISYYDVNFDEQPVGTDGNKVPYTGTLYDWLTVDVDDVRTSSGEISGYSNDTIMNAGVYDRMLLRDHAFFIMTENAPDKSKYKYYMTLNTDSTAKNGGVPTFYLQTERTTTGSVSPTLWSFAFAFDMSEIFSNSDYVKDVKENGINCEQVEFYLYFQSGIDKTTSKPIFSIAKNPNDSSNKLSLIRIKSSN